LTSFLAFVLPIRGQICPHDECVFLVIGIIPLPDTGWFKPFFDI
jgi:hypothetical protein